MNHLSFLFPLDKKSLKLFSESSTTARPSTHDHGLRGLETLERFSPPCLPSPALSEVGNTLSKADIFISTKYQLQIGELIMGK